MRAVESAKCAKRLNNIHQSRTAEYLFSFYYDYYDSSSVIILGWLLTRVNKYIVLLRLSRVMDHNHGFPDDVVKEIQDMIDAADSGVAAPITTFDDIVERGKELGFVKADVFLSPDVLLCHPSNRGSLGVNGWNAQKNGAEIAKTGVTMRELNGSTCFQMCPFEPKKSEQYDFNTRVVEQGRGLLAPVTRRETHLTVGAGHFKAWVSAIKAGCRTPYAHLSDQNGKLSKEYFVRKDHRMNKCLEGWPWCEFAWIAEVAWPKLPDLCQRALNAHHGVTSRSTEIEIMVWVSEQAVNKSSGAQFEDITKSIALSGPPCAPYIDSVAKLAITISGGEGAPTLHFLDRVQKSYGENKTLGEEFCVALCNLTEVSKVNKILYAKVALVCSNLIGEKVVDGIARLFVKGDVERFKNKDIKPKVIDADCAIHMAMRVAQTFLEKSLITQNDFDDSLSRFMLRSMLLITEKQKCDPEAKAYTTLAELKQMFVTDVRASSGDIDHEEFKKLFTTKVSGASFLEEGDFPKIEAPGHSVQTTSSLVKSMEHHNDPEVIFNENGFELGDLVKEKGSETADIYVIISSGKDIKLSKYDEFGVVATDVVSLPLAAFLTKWSKHKGKPTQSLPGLKDACASEQIMNDVLRSKVFNMLFEFEQLQEGRSLTYLVNPSCVAATEEIPKGKLKLAPMTLLSNLSVEKKCSTVAIKVDDTKVFATAPPAANKLENYEKYMFIPYWWVKSDTDIDKANMRFVSVKVGDVSIPILQNMRKIEVHQRLIVHKQKVVKEPLKDAVVEPLMPQPKGKKRSNRSADQSVKKHAKQG